MESSHPQEFHGNLAQPYMVRPQTAPTFLKHPQTCPISHNPHYPQFPTLNAVGIAVGPRNLPGSWSTGLCHCCDDPSNCLITAICPCITFGQIAEIVNEGSPSCGICGAAYALLCGIPAAACICSCCYRSKMRARFDLEESPCADCLVHFCCQTCALCQEYRELKNRGFDMGIGWEANKKRMISSTFTTPPVIGGNMRS